MSGVVLVPDNQETRRAINTLARHEMIVKLLADINRDMMVCDIEGWDRMEYINMLRDIINGLGKDSR